MGHPVLLGPLGARAGVEGDEDGRRPRAGSATRCSGRPLGREEDSMRAMRLSVLELQGRLALQGTLRAQANRVASHWSTCVWPQPNDICRAAGTATTRTPRGLAHRRRPARSSPSPASRSATAPPTSALDGISFDIYPGEFVFLVGASGSGKSTMMRLLIKESEPTAGEIRVAGRDLARDPAPARAVLPPQPRRDLPGLQAAAEPHRVRERRLRAAGHGRQPARDPRQGAGHPAPHRPLHQAPQLPRPALAAASSSASRSRARSSTTRRC